jgi:hypothetical protein
MEVRAMKRKVCTLLLVFVALLIITAGCTSSQPSVIKEKATKIDMNGVYTVGNHSYIPLYECSDATPEQNQQRAQDMLQVLNAFEGVHPELEVISWNEHDTGYSCIYGLWVNHRPR